MKRIVSCVLIMPLAVSLALFLTVMASANAKAASSVEEARQRMLREDREKEEAAKARVKAEAAERLRRIKQAGFVAVSEDDLHYEEAVAFCKRHGGRLPRINNSASWDGKNPPARGIPVEVFGYGDRPWEEMDLVEPVQCSDPEAKRNCVRILQRYWTDTKVPESTASGMRSPWYVRPVRRSNDYFVTFDYDHGARVRRTAICIPATGGSADAPAGSAAPSKQRSNTPTGVSAEAQRLQQAAEQGDAVAQNKLGTMYFSGKGVAEDKRQAAKWFQKAAEQGNADAQYNLGLMYENGLGVAKDERKAVEWHQKAAAQGDEDAKKALGRLGRK